MSLTAYRLARSMILDSARRRRAAGVIIHNTTRSCLTLEEHRRLISCRLLTPMAGNLTWAVFSRMGTWR